MAKYIIDRSKWVCGDAEFRKKYDLGGSKLLNAKGKMCCLGQVCLQDGLSEDDIRGKGGPTNVYWQRLKDHWMTTPENNNSRDACHAMNINDSINSPITGDWSRLTQEEREEELKKLFESMGHEIEFVGEFE